MEKTSSKEMQCVGRLEIERPNQPVGFLCGSIPVPTDHSFHSFSSALLPSPETEPVSAPRYRMLPTETDLKMPPQSDTVLPVPYCGVPSSTSTPEGIPWDDGAVTTVLSRKGEALAVSGLVDYGDEIDVIAPADIIKQIFKMPYSKGRLSIAVHRVGRTLVLNPGPDVEEGERLVRRNQPKTSDESLFLNFAMHSVRMEACDCPPTHSTSSEGNLKSSVLHDSRSSSLRTSDYRTDKIAPKEGREARSDYSKGTKDTFYWENKKNKRNKTPRTVHESEKSGGDGQEEFSRVLFWQFHNFRMLLGSDLLVFSNEKYVSVSLHLWDVSRKVTPLTWLEAWLDNIMASVPELAICYHRNGVVKSYELLKTDDIFLLKGVAEDGSPTFHPYVVQQNGLSVLRFLQANCKQDPGAYWLYKNAGEDVIQLFDLSVIPKTHSSESDDGCTSSLSSLIIRGRGEALLSLGTLLYRIAHRLSLSLVPSNRFKCARYVRQCLELLDEPDHLVVRAYAHEQFARLILNGDEELDLTEVFPLASEITIVDQEEDSLDIVSCISESSIQSSSCSDMNTSQDLVSEASGGDTSDVNVFVSNGYSECDILDAKSAGLLQHHKDEGYNVFNVTSSSANINQAMADPISSKLAAVHHISQAIKSLRWTRQLQGAESDLNEDDDEPPTLSGKFSVCACGDADCIEVCDIREWLPTSKLDHKLWKLILLLGESYLALGQTYKEDSQLLRALKVVEVACSVYGSVPQYLEDAKFISSMVNGENCQNGPISELVGDQMQLSKSSYNTRVKIKDFRSTYLFWAKAWTLVGDVYVDFLTVQGKEISPPPVQPSSTQELRMSSEVVKELIRLKKKLGQDVVNCSTCSLLNCSCQSDRASSGNSASSSGVDIYQFTHGRRQGKKNSRNTVTSLFGCFEENRVQYKGDFGRNTAHNKPKKDLDTAGGIAHVDDGRSRNPSSCTTKEDTGTHSDVAGGGSSESTSMESPKTASGGIFKYLQGPGNMDADNILSTALICYEAAIKAFGELSVGWHELQSVLKKIGWVCNELGRNRLGRKNLSKAEVAFAKAIDAFREISDHTNVILIYCNLGHGRRGLAEELVTKMEYLKSDPTLRDAYKQAFEAAKIQYGESLKFYRAAKSELSNIDDEGDDVSSGLRKEVCTQFAHTYLRLGMLLAREETVEDVRMGGEERLMGSSGLDDKRIKKDVKTDISANDAIREALSIYESMGELRRQEAAYAYFQLACYQKDRCLKFYEPSHIICGQPISESSTLQRAKQYLNLAERNWEKAAEFYRAKTHPIMYLTILVERAALLSNISSHFLSHTMLETALSCLLEGRHISEKPQSDVSENLDSEIYAKFWRQLQMLLKTMLACSLPRGPNKTTITSPATSSSRRSGDAEKLKELYRMSLKSTDFHQLHIMNSIWTGVSLQDHKSEVVDDDKHSRGG